MAGARVSNITGQNGFEHLVQSPDAGRVEVSRASAGLQQKQRFRVEGCRIEIVGIRLVDQAHGLGIRHVLLPPTVGIEHFHVARHHGFDKRALALAGEACG